MRVQHFFGDVKTFQIFVPPIKSLNIYIKSLVFYALKVSIQEVKTNKRQRIKIQDHKLVMAKLFNRYTP